MEYRVQILAVRGWAGWSIGALVDHGGDLMPMHGGVRLTVTKMARIA